MPDTATATSAAATAATAAPKSVSQTDKEKLQDDYDTFLNLFLTQLQNQDPLSPLDNNEFTNSLANLSQVEQGVKTNENLEDLVTLARGTQQDYGDPVSYIGKEVEFNGDTLPLEDGDGAFSYNVDGPAESVSIVIKDENGSTVFTQDVPAYQGKQTFAWDGKDDSFRDLPDGTYSVSATSFQGETPTTLVTSARALVTEAAFDGSDISLKVGSSYIPISDVQRVRDPETDEG